MVWYTAFEAATRWRSTRRPTTTTTHARQGARTFSGDAGGVEGQAPTCRCPCLFSDLDISLLLLRLSWLLCSSTQRFYICDR